MSLETSINNLAAKIGQDYKTLTNNISAETTARITDDTAESTTRAYGDSVLQTAINNLQSALQANINAITNTLNGQSLVKADVLGRNIYIPTDTNITAWAATMPTIGKYNVYITTAQGGLPAAWYYIELDRHCNDYVGNSWYIIKATTMGTPTTAGKIYYNANTGNSFTGWICREDEVAASIATKQPKLYDGWNNQDANTLGGNKTNFTYANNAPYVGPIVTLGESGYDLQLNGPYGWAGEIAFRIKNGDSGTWNTWHKFITDKKLLSTNADTSINIDNINVNTIGYVTNVNNAIVSQPNTDGGVISTRHSSAWGSDTYIDFRTGQMSSRGKDNGNVTAWNEVQHRNMRMNGFALGQNLASYSNENGTVQGNLVIKTKIPAASNRMFDIDIQGYDYSGVSAWDVKVSGYTYTGNTFYNTGYSGNNTPTADIKFAVTPDGFVCVLLGSTTWTHPKVVVKSAKIGYIYSSSDIEGWTIVIDNALSSYTNLTNIPAIGLNAKVSQLETAVTNAVGVTSSAIINALGYTPANGSSYLPLTGGNVTGNIVISNKLSLSTAGTIDAVNISVANEGASHDPYGAIGVTKPAVSDTPGYYGLTRNGQIGWMLGVSPSNEFVIGTGTGGYSSRITDNKFALKNDGDIWTRSYGNLHDKFVTVDVSQQITGSKAFISNYGSTSVIGSNSYYYNLQAAGTDGGAAGMTFHRFGQFAVNMGLDPDNVFRIGGFSASANLFELNMSGRLTLAGGISTNAGASFFGTGISGSSLHLYGSATIDNGVSSSWYSSSGQAGWINSTYGGGIYMTDTTYIRTYGGKQFYCDSNIIAGGQLQAGTNITAGGSITAQGNVTGYSDERLKI
jgi:hypothetical protein